MFIDAEEVVWFATDKGVCRYDPHAARTEAIAGDANVNYVRALWLDARGRLLAGTNAGLYVNSGGSTWNSAPDIGRRIVFALNQDNVGLVLVGTSNGLFATSSGGSGTNPSRLPAPNTNLPQGESVRAIATINSTNYVAIYGYGVEKLTGLQRTFVWPEAGADNRAREVTALGSDTNGRVVIGTATAGVFFWNGKQTVTEAALEKLKGEAVWSLLADRGGLWIASGRGLYFFKDGQLRDIAPGVQARREPGRDIRRENGRGEEDRIHAGLLDGGGKGVHARLRERRCEGLVFARIGFGGAEGTGAPSQLPSTRAEDDAGRLPERCRLRENAERTLLELAVMVLEEDEDHTSRLSTT